MRRSTRTGVSRSPRPTSSGWRVTPIPSSGTRPSRRSGMPSPCSRRPTRGGPRSSPPSRWNCTYVIGRVTSRRLRNGSRTATPRSRTGLPAGAVAAAVDATSGPDGRATPEALIAEGSALRLRYDREGRPEDLDRALDLLSEGVARTTEGADRASPLAILAVARRMRYARTGDLRDLDDAVDEGRPEVLGSLATVLFTRAALTGELTDLDEAVVAARDAFDATPAGTHGHALAAGNLGIAWYARYQRTDRADDLDAAIVAGRLALD